MSYKKSVLEAVLGGRLIATSASKIHHEDWYQYHKCRNCRVYIHESELVKGNCPFCNERRFE